MLELLYFIIGLITGAFIVFVWYTTSEQFTSKLSLKFKINDLKSELEKEKSVNDLLRKELLKK